MSKRMTKFMKSKLDWTKKKRQIAIDSKKFEWFDRAWVSTDAKGAWHSRKYWTVISGTRWFCQFYYIMLCYILGFWGFTSDWHPLFQIPNSSPVWILFHCLVCVRYEKKKKKETIFPIFSGNWKWSWRWLVRASNQTKILQRTWNDVNTNL